MAGTPYVIPASGKKPYVIPSAGSSLPNQSFNVANSTPAVGSGGSIFNNFTPAQGQSLGNFLKETVKAVPSSVQKVSQAVAKVPYQLAEPVTRDVAQGVVTLEKGALSAAMPSRAQQFANVDIPTGNSSLFLGKEPISGLADTAARYETALKKRGIPGATPLAVLGSTIPLGLDAIGAGPEGRSALEALRAAKTAEEVLPVLTKAGFEPSIAKDYAPIIAKETDTAKIKDAWNAARKLQESTSASGASARTAQPLLQSSARDTSTVEQALKESPQVSLSTSPEPIRRFSSPTPYTSAEDYVKEQVAAQKAAAGVEKPGVKGSVSSFLKNAKAKMVDSTAPIEDTLNAAAKKAGVALKPSEDIHNQIDRVLRAPTLAGQFVRDNGLDKVIQKAADPATLDQYLIAKHGMELASKGVETGRNLAKDTALVADLGSKYEPLAKDVYAYSQKLMDYAVQSGLISPTLAETLRSRYPDYVPFNRIFSELETKDYNFGGKAVASLSSQSFIKSIEGSTRQVESPLQSLLAKTHDVFAQGERNQAAKLLASYKELPGNPFQLRELTGSEKAPYTISFLDNGVKRAFATTKEIAEAAKSLNVQQMNILGKIFALPVRIARIGITGINIPFLGANIVKDQFTAFVNSDKALSTSLANPNNFIKSLFSAVKHDDLYQEMVRAGGGGTSFDIARDQVPSTFAKIRAERSVKTNALYLVKHPADLFRAVENVLARSEELTRVQQFRGTKTALLKQGTDANEAVIGAARAARDNTVNFARKGEWGPVLNAAFLYLNAGIQGTRTFLRVAKTRPVATAAKLAIGGFFPIAAVTAWNLNDPTRAAAYKDIPEYEKQNNLIIVPPNPTQDAQGRWNVIKIPISQEFNNLFALARRPIEAAYGLDPVKFGDFATALIGSVTPVQPTSNSLLSTFVPQAIKPTAEYASNYNFFQDRAEVPQGLSDLSPAMQVKPTTSPIATTIARALGLSPIKVQDFITESGGGVAQQLLGIQDPFSASAARFNKAAGGATQDKAFQMLTELKQQSADNTAEVKDEAATQYARLAALPSDQAHQEYAQIEADNPTLATKIADIKDAKDQGLSSFETNLKLSSADARAAYIYQQTQALPTKEAKNQALADYRDKKILTSDVEDKFWALVDNQAPAYKPGDKVKDSTLIHQVATYAEAVGVDPGTAFNRIFTGQHISKVINGTVIVDRMSLQKSEAIKQKLGGDSSVTLDHVIPLELGGSNAESNLKLVPKDEAAKADAVENYLGAALREKKVSKNDAQQFIQDFKNSTMTFDQIQKRVGVPPVSLLTPDEKVAFNALLKIS